MLFEFALVLFTGVVMLFLSQAVGKDDPSVRLKKRTNPVLARKKNGPLNGPFELFAES